MATRSLTDVFLLMRNNAQQTRHMYAGHGASDSEALVGREPELEPGPPPPGWLAAVQQVQFGARELEQRLAELTELRQRHLTRPTLDDSSADERRIDALQREMTAGLGRCQRSLQLIQRAGQAAPPAEARLNRPVVLALAGRLQQLSGEFRGSQGHYLRLHQQREQRAQGYFDALLVEERPEEASEDRAFMLGTDQELLRLEESRAALEQRDTEVQHLVSSITELNTIFRDLAQMVAEQGQVVDRIDANVETTQVRVSQGLTQLQKADRHQRRGRKMTCILGLAAVVVLLLIVLISVKS